MNVLNVVVFISVFMSAISSLDAECVTTTGDNCIDSCAGKDDGKYQSCNGCEVYATCTNSILEDDKPCSIVDDKPTHWDDVKKDCTKKKNKLCKLIKTGDCDDDKCITSCENKEDGDYASCNGCDVYASCTGSVLQDDIPCGMSGGKHTYWDDKKKECTKKKPKHCDDDHDDDHKCIKSCEKKEDGDYASCNGCDAYATCTGSVLQDDIPCGMSKGKQTYWDDKKKECTKKKPKHCDDDDDDDDDDKHDGSVYTRWGRTTCPDESELIYTGYMAGSLHSNIGGGSNALCLSSTPDLSDVDYGMINTRLYGAEYEFGKGGVSQNENVPCTVCETSHSKVLMIPGQSQCGKGWHMEYTGFITAESFANHRSEFLCMDYKPESLPGGNSGNEDALDVYGVNIQCGAIPCPPYEDRREIHCVVCSR